MPRGSRNYEQTIAKYGHSKEQYGMSGYQQPHQRLPSNNNGLSPLPPTSPGLPPSQGFVTAQAN